MQIFIKRGTNPSVCPHRKGVLQLGVILFGDPMAPDFFEAERALTECDLLLVAGISLQQVYPVTGISQYADKLVIKTNHHKCRNFLWRFLIWIKNDVRNSKSSNSVPGEANAIKEETDVTGILKVHVIDVGQADSILVQLPSGENILIDNCRRCC